MIERYTRPEMAVVWSERRRLDIWQAVEALATEGWEAVGVAPPGVAERIRLAPAVDVATWKAREEITRHDLAAFVDVLAGSVDAGGEWVHYGLTSSDVTDTALGVQLTEASALLLDGIAGLYDVVRRRAFEHRETLMVGRTHGMWAEPTTFGLKLAGWAFELIRAWRRVESAADGVRYGTISGAVGTRAHVPATIESHVCARLGLRVEPAPTQVVARDRHAAFLSALALAGASLERFATEIRHLQRSEVSEVSESFSVGQKGSSAMPHKRNPILSENVTGIARLLRGWAQAGMENVALWHERDISHSSVERVALPDACLALDFAVARMTTIVSGMVVHTDRMASNLEATRGLVHSQAVLLAMVERGMARDEAYRVVQQAAARAWEDGDHLSEVLAADPACPLGAAALKDAFAMDRYVDGSAGAFTTLERATLQRPV